MSLPLQFLPLDWLPFGRHILKALGDDAPPAEGMKLFVFVIWSVLNPMLLLRDLRLSMSTLLFIYGGNLVYVDISVRTHHLPVAFFCNTLSMYSMLFETWQTAPRILLLC
jgi:hypothetical protein